jgi:predicted amidohydrolase
MKIAAVQMVSTPDWPSNRDAAARLVAQAAAAGATLVALPEYFCLMGQRDSDKLALAEAPGDGPAPAVPGRHRAPPRRCGWWAARCRCAAPPGARCSTAAACSGPTAAAAHYDKMHLFAYDNGRERYDEGRTLQAGSAPVAGQTGALRVGLSICYDLRFPELYRALMTPPCDVLCVPARLHPHHRPGALGTAAARPRGGEPVLCAGAGAGRPARQRPAHLGPQHGRRALGRGAGRVCPKARAWPGRSRPAGTSPRCASSCRHWRTGVCRP